MSNQWIDFAKCEALAVLVESVAGPLLVAHPSPVCLELDIPFDIRVPADPKQTAELIGLLIRQSLTEMPDGGDLTISAVASAAGTELEIADSGNDISQRPTSRPLVAAALAAELKWQDCPQGGGCVTAIFPPRQHGQTRLAA